MAALPQANDGGRSIASDALNDEALATFRAVSGSVMKLDALSDFMRSHGSAPSTATTVGRSVGVISPGCTPTM